MSETAGRLAEEVIPKIPTRQWVLSLPVPCKSRILLISIVQNQHATRDILKSLKMSTAPPSDLCGPKDHVVEYYSDQVRYTNEEEPPIPDF